MKAEEKNIIFNLLKKSDSYVNGFSSKNFNINPVFSDDEETFENIEIKPENNDFNISEVQFSSDNQVYPEQPPITEVINARTEDKPAEPENIPAENENRMSISEINAKILRCTRCNLARTRNNVVPGMGVEHPDVLVIGEGPGYDEDQQGLPFVGKAGILLDKMLNAIQLDRKTNCYIANIVKCRPPENRDPKPEEQSSCIGFLEAQISILKPKMILCMGRIAGHKILNCEIPMNQMHGKFSSYKNIPVMVTYHPSALLRDESLKRPAWDDLKIFRRKLDELN